MSYPNRTILNSNNNANDDDTSYSSNDLTSTSNITISNVNNYSNYSYYVEDTSEGCYRDISNILQRKLFTKGSYKKKSKQHSDKKLPIKNYPLFIWTINEKDIDFNELKPFQICNHYEGITTLTTKNGFCDLLKDMLWISEECNDISPRSYNLGDPIHRDEFIDDFRISAASNILKFIINKDISSKMKIKINDKILKDCMNAISFYLRIKLEGEWPGVERNFWQESTTAYCGLEDDEWKLILNYSYDIAEVEYIYQTSIENIRKNVKTTIMNPKDIRINLLLLGLSKCNKQFCTDGIKNMWIVKAPEACRGVNMKVSYRLEDILEYEKGMGGRTVQKYVESPLLAPLNANSNIDSKYFAKFDLRVWVLVVSFVPLKAFIYPIVYGRRCSSPYDLSIKNFNESLIHLTNYAIQKKSTSKTSVNSNQSKNENIDDFDSNRKDSNGTNRSTSNQTDLLVSHDEVLQIVGVSNWMNMVWPEIKRKIKATLEITKPCINPRKNSFEFLGYDIIIDNNLNPWVLEVNMSPAMAHRTDTQSNIIANMTEKMIDIILSNHSTIPTSNINQSNKIDWEVLASESKHQIITTNMNSNQEWKQVTFSQVRPSSAKATRPISANNQKLQQVQPGIPIDFAIVGKAITHKMIDSYDIIIHNFSNLVKMQRRAKIYISRLRKYHYIRKVNSIIIQKYVRRFLGQCRLFRLILNQKAITIQCFIRMFLSRQRLLFKIKTIDAITIQSIVRMRLARLLFIKKRKIFYLKKILKWRRHLLLVYRRKKVFILVTHIRKWYSRRVTSKRIIFKCITRNYTRRTYYANYIKRSIRSLTFTRKVFERINKKNILKKLAYSCVIKFNDLMEKKLEKSECLQMNDSDNFSNLLRDYNNLIEKNIVNDDHGCITSSNSPCNKSSHQENSPALKSCVHDNWNSIFDSTTTTIDMGLSNLSSTKKANISTKPVGDIYCIEDFVAKHMSNSTNPVTNTLNPKAKAYIRLLKRTLGIEYFNNSQQVVAKTSQVSPSLENNDEAKCFTPQQSSNSDDDTKEKHIPDELKESIQQMEITMKYYDNSSGSNSTFIPQQPSAQQVKRIHKLRPKSASDRRKKDNNSSSIDNSNQYENHYDMNPNSNTNNTQTDVPNKKSRPKSATQRRSNNNNDNTNDEANSINTSKRINRPKSATQSRSNSISSNSHQMHNTMNVPIHHHHEVSNNRSIQPKSTFQFDSIVEDTKLLNDNLNPYTYFDEMDRKHNNWVSFLQQKYGDENNFDRSDCYENNYQENALLSDYGELPILPLVSPVLPVPILPAIDKKAIAIKATKSSKSTRTHANSNSQQSSNTKVKKTKNNSNGNADTRQKNNSESMNIYDVYDDPYNFAEVNVKKPKKYNNNNQKKVKIGFDDFFLQGLM